MWELLLLKSRRKKKNNIHSVLVKNIFQLLGYIHSQDDICHETHSTLEFVAMCPDSEPLKLKHSKKKQCHSFPACNGGTLVYHCVRYRERLVEVCAPRHVITGNSYMILVFQGVLSILK